MSCKYYSNPGSSHHVSPGSPRRPACRRPGRDRADPPGLLHFSHPAGRGDGAAGGGLLPVRQLHQAQHRQRPIGARQRPGQGARAAGRHRAAQVRPGRPGGTTRRAPDGAFQRTLRQRCRPGAGRYQQAPGTTPRLPARRTGKASPPARRRARQPDQQGRQPAARTDHPRRPDRQPATPAGAGQRRRRALPGADGQGLHLHGPVAATPGRAARPAPDPARPGARTHVAAAAVDRAPQRTRRAFRAPGQPARGNPPPAQRGGAGPGRKRSQAHLAGHRAGERHRHRRARRSRADRRQLASAAEHRSRRHPVAGRTLRAEQVHRFHPAGRRGADPLPGLSVPEVRPVPRQGAVDLPRQRLLCRAFQHGRRRTGSARPW